MLDKNNNDNNDDSNNDIYLKVDPKLKMILNFKSLWHTELFITINQLNSVCKSHFNSYKASI